MRRHAGVDELSLSWEVGRDGEEQPGLGREPVSSEDRHGHPAGLGVLSQEGQEPQGTAWAPELSTAWGVCSSALGSSLGSWRAGVTTAVAPPGKRG